ncbi:hypothetical protein MFIFM68171_08596 [Madurella fahalii]|uniref:C2H2-type domain-containing protein n=1 Tax=Madurella fahalii TaxID=1157608 RepID=A0ABQ0GKX8_9PEZI
MAAFKAIIQGLRQPNDLINEYALERAQDHLDAMGRLSSQLIRAKGKEIASPVRTKDEGDSDALQTDSGYCSAELVSRQALVPGANELEKADLVRNEDAMTVLSAITEDLPDAARRAIVDVCESISRQIREQVRDADRNSFLAVLPGIIKSFAVRFGLDNSHYLSRTIMSFVYAHHREIAAMLKSLIFGDEDDGEAETSRSRRAEGMSIADKMILWGAKSQDDPGEPESSDRFVGVEDDYEHGATQPDLSLYTQMILGSQPYQWLIGSLLRESSFHWDDTQPRIMVDEVRQRIVCELPTGVISSKREPSSHTVTFQLKWRPIHDRLQHEQSVHGVGLGDALVGSIVLTSSSAHEIQATTVEQYLIQTWGPSSIYILRVLQAAIEDEAKTSLNLGSLGTRSPTGEAGIRASIDSKQDLLSISVTGPACLIGERAEQLAWLAATFQFPLRYNWLETHIHSKPWVKKVPCAEGETVWFLANNNEPKASERALILLSSCIGRIVYPVIARGFPTARRPEFCPGIEIPAPMFRHFFNLGRLKESPTLAGAVVDGHAGMLKLVKKVGRLFVWHMLQLRVPSMCSCQLDLCQAGDGGPQDSEASTNDDMNQSRHILGDCPASAHGDPRDTDTMSDTSWSARTAHCWKDKGDDGEGDVSPLTEGSQETSLDSDMLSISDSSDCGWPKFAEEHEEYYCERCKAIFQDKQSHEYHLQQPCVLDPDATLDGITHQQHRQLARRSNPALCESEQWFVIWDGLFPGRPRPSSAYLDTGLSEDLCQYREYVRRSGHEVLAQELQRRGIRLSLQRQDADADADGAVQEAAVREAMSRSLDLLFDDWLSSRGDSERSSISSGSRGPLPYPKRQRVQRPPTPTSSFADSGISLLNYPPAILPQPRNEMQPLEPWAEQPEPFIGFATRSFFTDGEFPGAHRTGIDDLPPSFMDGGELV